MKEGLTAILCCFITLSYCQDGTIDSSFGINGRVFQSPSPVLGNYEGQIKVQTDGKIVQIGSIKNGNYYDFAVNRYKFNGAPDSSFGINGKLIIDFGGQDDFAWSLAMQSDGKIVIVGRTDINPDPFNSVFKMAMVRLNSDGSFDLSFNSTGKVTTSLGSYHDFARSVIIQTDGKIIIGGWSDQGTIVNTNYDFALVRYNTDGILDNSFGNLGKVLTSINTNDGISDIALQADGKILAAGATINGVYDDFALIRYKSDGSIDNSFGNAGKVITATSPYTDYITSVAIQTDGKIVVAGEGFLADPFGRMSFIITRYNSSGNLDTSFNGTGVIYKTVGSLADNCSEVLIQFDNKILVTGQSTSIVGQPDFTVLRYNTNGSPDITFGNGGVALLNVGSGFDYSWSIAMQGPKIIVGGFSVLNDNNRYFSLVRLKNTPANFCTLSLTDTNSLVKCYGTNTGQIYLSVNGGMPPYSYSWSNGANTKDIIDIPAGNYKVIVTDFFGCKDSIGNILITQPADLQISETHTNLSCQADSKGSIGTNLTGGTLPYKYQWNNSQTTKDLNNLNAGLYQLTVSDSNGCVKTISVAIAPAPASCLEKEIIVYPNPTEGILKIRFKGYREIVRIRIYDALARKIKEQSITVTNPWIEEIHTQYISAGIYFLVIETAEKTFVKKYMKQ
jgi:uncharacterized delta-60 repeat protein